MKKPSPLPINWVQKIFVTLQGHYGTRFLNMWKTGQVLPDGNDAGVINAMQHWAERLGGFADQPETIKNALQHLPVEPPSLPQFVELLRHSYVPDNNLQLTRKFTQEEITDNKLKAAQYLDRLRSMVKIKNVA
jgi:hypothetical protein